MAIWTLQTGSDFTAFRFLDEVDKVYFEELVKNYFDEFKMVSRQLRPLHMLRTEPKKHPDFFEIEDTDVIAISQNAVDALQPFLKKIELLLIITDAGNYYAMNVLCFVDCIEKNKSEYVSTSDGTIVTYTSLEFDKNKVKGYSIFRIPQLPYKIFVSSDIEDICEQEELKGLEFDPEANMVWAPNI